MLFYRYTFWQSQERQGYGKFLMHYVGDVILVGINYDKQTKVHSCKIEKIVKK